MTVEELLKQQPQMGQGGASQYLSMPQQQYGAGQYLGGLLGPQFNFNAPTGMVSPQYSGQTYQPTPWKEPSEMYKLGSLLSQSNEPLFRWVGNDMMKKTPMATWTITQN